jgi:hypothetical protein
MTYMLLVVEPQGDRARRTPDEGRALFERMVTWSGQLKDRKLLLGVNSLKTEATRVAVRAGKGRSTDGPFTESKELIGGYFLVDCRTRAEALELAQQCPAAQWATMEVREIGPCFE